MTTTVAPSLAGPGQQARPRRRGIRRTWPMYLAVAPFFILFIAFGLYPTLYSLVLSFQDWNGLGDPTWVGLENFQKLFTDPTFYLSIRNTFVIFALSTFPMLVIAIVIAAMLNSAVRYSTAFRIAYFIPNITSVVAMAVLFGSIFGQNFGLANTLLHAIGLPAVPWLSTPFGIQVTVSLLITYQWTGYNAIIFLAGMQSIGGEVYEAAKIDGAGAFRSFFSITLPLLRPTIIFVLVVSTITGLQSFTEAQVLTTTAGSTNSGGAGQGGLTMVLYFYQQAFGFNRFGYGAAIAWGVFLIVVVFTIISWRFTAGRKEEARA